MHSQFADKVFPYLYIFHLCAACPEFSTVCWEIYLWDKRTVTFVISVVYHIFHISISINEGIRHAEPRWRCPNLTSYALTVIAQTLTPRDDYFLFFGRMFY